ncbi:MAG: SMP-30/gluconolactonase/LRE family protein [Planctomycetota bacterium]|nr:SMP-30/gluconolactonase/LRE family protein [Planctomycetota bacterium]
MPEIHAIANYHCNTGENPLWNDRDGKIYWEDIPPGRLFRADPVTGEHENFFTSTSPIGGFTFQDDDALLLFQDNKIARLSPDGKYEVLKEGIDGQMTRFNDVIADPEGRVYAGTMSNDPLGGGLFKVERDLSVTCLFRGTGCSNGMGFTPDLKQFYWTCSTRRKIYLYDYDRRTGALTRERLFYNAPPTEGFPDGMTVDTDGFIWTTRWDGYAMLKLSPEGRYLDKIGFPVGKVSSCVFGGANLDELFVTTAGGKDGKDTLDGTLYRVTKVGARGTKEFRSKIGL